MKIEDNVYILTKEINNETIYLTSDYEISDDVRVALKAVNKITASLVKKDYEYENNDCIFDLKIVPLKITYEW